jgi:hypothetical protein
MYFGDETKKFQDPMTGAHFEYIDLCRRIEIAMRERMQREMIEKEQQEH